ncbi:TonB-dependent receptor [Chitinophaga lutea]|uniref:TonB-dependent receptor n=1 Tax=Chitinophaga lutea TaxID=2488634 RepID=A0A3N4PPV7_9BACT|nr:TonB-dependent receptor [Chitinophaga lutea]RPE09755.1 TonB-dependent receptor [Chitinophaga lutea]
MKFGTLRLCLRIALLCLLTAEIHAQQVFASAARQTGGTSAPMVPLKDALETIYKKHKVRVVYNEQHVRGVLLPEQLLRTRGDQLIVSMQRALQPYRLVLNRIGEAQFAIAPEAPTAAPVAKPVVGAAKIRVAGLIKDKLGSPIIGVTVRVTGNTGGTLSNTEGFYAIEVEPTDTLEFSFIGYETQRIAVRNKMDLNVTMEAKEGGLNEVVVVGFGAQKKISLVGAQSTIKPAELKQPGRSLTNALGGRLAGIVAVQKSGEPGADEADIYIRGVSTFSSSQQGPLIIVDGVPDRSIADIDAEDIESFTILKDASATAVYGTRGANGVIIVNTKAGKPGKPNINVEMNQAFTRFTQLPEYVDAPTFMRLYNEGLVTRGGLPQWTDEQIAKHASGADPDLYPNVDWFKTLFNEWGNNRKASLNVRGGSDVATYYFSAGYFSEVGMSKRDAVQAYNSVLKLDRYNFTTNVDVNITKTTKLELGVQGNITNENKPSIGAGALFSEAARVPPNLIPPVYSTGQAPKMRGGGFISPYINLTRAGYGTEYRNRVNSNIRVRQNLDFLVKGLTFSSMFAFDSYAWNEAMRRRTVPNFYAESRNTDGSLVLVPQDLGSNVLNFEASRGGNRRFYTETSLNYSRSFGHHDVSGLLLYNQSDYVNGDATTLIPSIPFRQRGISGRATYGFDNRYFTEVNFGYNGSENFAPNKRYGFFPSFGAGWVVSNEKFFQPFRNTVSHLKLRYTYGISGNSHVKNENDRFLFLTRILSVTTANGGFQFGVPGSTVSYAGMEEGQVGSDVSWETAKRQNLGLEVKMLRDKISLIVDLFKEDRTGILVRHITVPYTSGFTNSTLPFQNVGVTSNKGIDLTLEVNHAFNANYYINFRGNFTYNKNLSLYDGRPAWDYPWRERTGHTISQRFGYVAEGLFKDSAEIMRSPKQAGSVRPGDIKYKDMNGDGIINTSDEQAIGLSDVPRIMYGLNLSVGIRRFDILMFWQGAGMVDFHYSNLSNGINTVPFMEGHTNGNLYAIATDRWTPDNPNPRPFYPRMSTRSDPTSNYLASTWWIKRADYIRLKELMVGYNFNVKGLQKFSVKSLRLYLQATNVLTFSPWKLWDPELTESRGIRYPQLSVYNMGLRVNFL